MPRAPAAFTALLCILLLPAANAFAAEALRLGVPLQASSALVIIADDRGLFAKEGVTVTTREYVSGKQALAQGLFTGAEDAVTASDVPVMLGSFERSDFAVVASIYATNDVNRVVARRDAGIVAPTDLKGKRIATQRGSAVHFFLDLFLLHHNMTEVDIDLSFRAAQDLPTALARSEIDAFSMRDPFVSEAQALLGEKAVIMAAPGIYDQSDLIVFTRNYLKRRPSAVTAFLRAVIRAQAFAENNARTAAEIVARRLGAPVTAIAKVLARARMRVLLDQALLLRLEDQANWALRAGLVRATVAPDFLDFLHLDALITAAPDRVTVIR